MSINSGREKTNKKIQTRFKTFSRGIGKQDFCNSTDNFKLGEWCFPNKKILRNSPCLPACKQKNIATRLRDTT